MASRKLVPWLFTETKGFRTWIWETQHFVAKIIGEGHDTITFSWQIIEKSEKGDFIFETSQSRNFREAELEIVETIAKSWDRKLGYVEYAGDLAYTYTIASGEKINFEKFIGNHVNIKYSSSYDEAESNGILGLKNYNILIKQENGKVIVVPPGAIRNITIKS